MKSNEGEGGWPVDLLCSRNARPEKVLVGRVQWEIKQATLPERQQENSEERGASPKALARANGTSREIDCEAIGGPGG